MTTDFCFKCSNKDSILCTICGIAKDGAREHFKPKPQTNYDRVLAMTVEELAVMLAWPYLASPPWCAEHTTCPYISEDPVPCDKCALDWLKQEVDSD